jgi:hypothetical protein
VLQSKKTFLQPTFITMAKATKKAVKKTVKKAAKKAVKKNSK